MLQFDNGVILLKETRFFRFIREFLIELGLSRHDKCFIDPALHQFFSYFLPREVFIDAFLAFDDGEGGVALAG